MNLSKNNFFKTNTPIYIYYGYESRGKLYDVVFNLEQQKWFFHTNSKPSEKTQYHEAVIKHFNLDIK